MQTQDNLNTSSISTHNAHPPAADAAFPGGLASDQTGAYYGTGTVAHSALTMHAALAYIARAQAAAAAAASPAPQQAQPHPQQQQQQPATATAATGAVRTVPGGGLLQGLTAGTVHDTETREQQRQQIISHVNELIRFCDIPQKQENDRITSVRQCSSSFFVLLCQRLFDVTIQGIDIYPNTPEKKRKNVSLVLDELRRNNYPVDDISATEVVDLNESALSRLILLFVSIAQDRGFGGTGLTGVGVGGGGGGVWAEVEKPTSHGTTMGATGGAAVPAPVPPPPYGTGLTAPPPGFTIAEVSNSPHFARQGVVIPGGGVVTAGGASGINDDMPAQAFLPPFYYPGAFPGDVSGVYRAVMQPQPQEQPSLLPQGQAHEGYMMDTGGAADAEEEYDEECAPTSGYEDSQPIEEDGATPDPAEAEALTRDEIVNNWYSGLVTPDGTHGGANATGDSFDGPMSTPYHVQQQQHQHSRPKSGTRRPLHTSRLLAEAADIAARTDAVSRSLNEAAARHRHQQQQPMQPQSQQQPRRGTIPSLSSSLTATAVGTTGLPADPRRRHPRDGAAGDASPSPHPRRVLYNGAPVGGATTIGTESATDGVAPRSAYRLLEEPPLTAVESRLLSSHPRRLIDTAARDRKTERLRARRFLGSMQDIVRQSMHAQFHAMDAEMRTELRASQRASRQEKIDSMRRVRDENRRYKDAYTMLMAAAANDRRVPRHIMSPATSRLAEQLSSKLVETRRMCDYLQQENERLNLEELVRYAHLTSAWQTRMPV